LARAPIGMVRIGATVMPGRTAVGHPGVLPRSPSRPFALAPQRPPEPPSSGRVWPARP
jgi:hypothetical protein